jgi:hypothetical protein
MLTNHSLKQSDIELTVYTPPSDRLDEIVLANDVAPGDTANETERKPLLDAGKNNAKLLKLVLENKNRHALVILASIYRGSEKTANALYFSTWAVLELERLLLINRKLGKQYTLSLEESISEIVKFISEVASKNSAQSNLARWCQGLITFTLQMYQENSDKLHDDDFLVNLMLCNAHHSFYSYQLADAIELGSIADKPYLVDKKYLYIHPIDEATSLPGRDNAVEMVSKSLFKWMGNSTANKPMIEMKEDNNADPSSNRLVN